MRLMCSDGGNYLGSFYSQNAMNIHFNEAKGSNKKLADHLDSYFKAICNECELEQLERNNSTI